ncbi:helix-turn-helix domain-containing protein [Cereibacter changlensis]|uniref:Transcriptional regulator n=2 Tax=Cereibacter changlensis TaxID=402884 RepID=A0A2T4JR38_9RHOB|nr:helix-turn-helix transcriptional regulator [Cereibacter changlensis]PTE20375.1 transcriptional regulator [Cereibacter changlensis JA139]PZX55318.1 helix-turn-helix protein [Cereibacter changlensis]
MAEDEAAGAEDGAAGWFSEATATFGDRMAGAREAAGLSQEDLARRLGVRLKTVQAWEDDLSEPRANRLQMMAGMLNVSLRWLLTGEGEGLEGPSHPGALTGKARDALAELSRMRAQMLALAQEMGHLEKRMRGLMREEAE